MKRAMLAISCLLVVTGCGSRTPSSTGKEAIDAANDPLRLDPALAWVFDPGALPDGGASANHVWTASYFPNSLGGTADAMDKYDAATNGGGKAGAWERADAAKTAGVAWSGHCNGLAAAGINEPSPHHPAVYNGVRFELDDVIALLIEKWQNSVATALVSGRRCDDEGSDAAECRDLNAGAMHVILGNFLGLKRQALIFDTYADEPVWNYPVISYRIESKEVIDAATAAQLIRGVPGPYRWNPQANGFLRVRTRVGFAAGEDHTYDYVLEEHDGRIVGGEWIGHSREDHPDFAWLMAAPAAANPYLDPATIDKIAALSR